MNILESYTDTSIENINKYIKSHGIQKKDVVNVNCINFDNTHELYELIYWEAE